MSRFGTMVRNIININFIDRSFSRLVWALATAKMVIFTIFALTLVQTSASLAKNTDENTPIVCSGKNLLIDLAKTDPDAMAEITKAASKVSNGASRFWKVEKPGLEPSWLLGTMHFADPRVTALPAVMESAFSAAQTVVIENTTVLDPAAMQKAMAELRTMMFFTDGSTLEKYYNKETLKLLETRMAGRNLPYFLAKRMQPWVVATAIAIPMCEVERKHRNQKVLDQVLGLRAQDEGKNLVGLESVREQIGAMASLPLDFHLKSLEETIKLGPKLDDMMATMLELYLQGDVGKFMPLMKYLSKDTTSSEGYAEFQEVMITKRNITMADRAAPQLEKGGVFMAVGALHLPGELGVVQLLKDAGYKVTPAL